MEIPWVAGATCLEEACVQSGTRSERPLSGLSFEPLSDTEFFHTGCFLCPWDSHLPSPPLSTPPHARWVDTTT